MALPSTETVECDILIIGGGMSGCGAAFEAKFWGRDLRVVMVEKAVDVDFKVTVLSACVITLDSTEVALTTEVFNTGEGVKVTPSVPASTSVEVLVTSGLVALMVATCFSVKVFVV